VPLLTRAQLVLLELAAAAVAIGLAVGGMWRWPAVAVALLLLALAVVAIQRRWLYQLALSWLSMVRRRQQVRGPGLQSLLGGYLVVTVPAGSQGSAFGVVRAGTTWSLPLQLTYGAGDDPDAPVPVDQLAALLRVEDVPMASVRLLTVFSSRPAELGSGLTPTRLMSRYCVLTMDTTLAADAVAARGGTEAALQQILRRCALRCEQIMATLGIDVRRLDEREVAELFAACVGVPGSSEGPLPRTVESWTDVRVSGTWSTSFLVTGSRATSDVAPAVARVAAEAATPVAVSTLLVRTVGPRAELNRTLLLRLSGPGSTDTAAVSATLARARAGGLVLKRMDGEQGRLLRASTPVGVGGGS
jgi:type VII secretion protein EccE